VPVERYTPSTSGSLIIKNEPGASLIPLYENDRIQLHVTGAQGARFLSQLIEEATALRDELRAVVG